MSQITQKSLRRYDSEKTSSWRCTALGVSTKASGDGSTSIGNQTIASANNSTAMGANSTASGEVSTAMGYATIASGSTSTAMGLGTTASGDISTAIGKATIASDYGSLVIGQYNFSGSSVTNSATLFDLENTAFVIGNGNLGSLSDAFKVNFNGDTTISNNLKVMGDVEVQSDARLKSNIVSLGATLFKLLQIDGKSYTMKKDESEKQKIGVLAQDIEKVFPELISESNGVKSVNYQGLIPVLINALKEQQSEIETYRNDVSELKEMVQALASRN